MIALPSLILFGLGLIMGLLIGRRSRARATDPIRPTITISARDEPGTCARCGTSLGRHWVAVPRIERICWPCYAVDDLA